MEYMLVAVIAAAIVIGLTLVSDRLGVAPSLILMMVGVVLSLMIPAIGDIQIDPAWILEGILPLLLYAAAVAMPTVELRRDFVAVGGLAVLLVIITAIVLGLIIHWLLPDVPLPLAIGVGAILSPTDAAATTTIKRLGVPGRVGTILQGESLFNDASALVLLRATIAVAGITAWQVITNLLWAAIIAGVIGAAVGWLGVRLRQLIPNSAATTAISFIIPFVAFVPAELLNASGLVAAVAAGIVAAHLGPHRLDARQRTVEWANWHTLAFLLEGAVFLMMGLELARLMRDLSGSGDLISQAITVAAIALVVALVVRGVFLAALVRQTSARDSKKVARTEQYRRLRLAAEAISDRPAGARPGWDPLERRWSDQATSLASTADLTRTQRRRLTRLYQRAQRVRAVVRSNPADGHRAGRRWAQIQLMLLRYRADVDYLISQPLGAREGSLLTWAGMRGVVTLAAAQTLPLWEPHRSLLILIAFMVAAGSLLIQGGTVPLAIRLLGLAGKDTVPPDERPRLDAELNLAARTMLGDPDLAQPDDQPYDPALVAAMAARFARADRTNSTEGAPYSDPSASPNPSAYPATPDDGTPTDPLLVPPAPDSPVSPAAPDDGATADSGHPMATQADGEPATGQGAEPRPAAIVSARPASRPGSLADIHLDRTDLQEQFHQLQLACLRARRERLLDLRSTGTYSSRTLSAVLAELDADEVSLQLRLAG